MAGVVRLRNIKRALAIEPNQSVKYILSGRISHFRPYKSFNFVDLVDGSTRGHLQVVIQRDILHKPELGSYITCQGTLVSSPGAKQEIEFKVNQLQYLGKCDPHTYPLATTSGLSDEWYRRWPHLRPRAPHFASLLRVRSELELGLHMIMKQMDFFRVHTPSLTSNDSEASSDLFVVKRTKIFNSQLNATQTSEEDDCLDLLDREYIDDDHDDGDDADNDSLQEHKETKRLIRDGYFNKDVFLVTSAQLHLESLAASLSRVYTLSTAFRAENSISTKHLCEFLMFEAEEANVTELEPLMNRVESIIKFIAQFLSEVSEHKSDFNSLLNISSNIDTYKKVAHSSYIRMNYNEALRILREKTDFSGETHYGSDIGRIQERKLLDYCDNVPIFITNYPRQLKPFYMKSDDKEAQCFDLIAPHGGEICGGSLREDSCEKLLANLKVHQAGNNLKHFDWYLDSRRFGSFPHGGFGIGVERLIQSLLGVRNIRDTTGFPRRAGYCPM